MKQSINQIWPRPIRTIENCYLPSVNNIVTATSNRAVSCQRLRLPSPTATANPRYHVATLQTNFQS